MSLALSQSRRLLPVVCGICASPALRRSIASTSFTATSTACCRTVAEATSPPYFIVCHGSSSLTFAVQRRCYSERQSSNEKLRKHCLRNKLPEDPFEFIAMNVRATLRHTGPIPLSKLTPLLPDEFMEALGQRHIGLAAFIDKYPNYGFTVELPGRVIIAFPQNLRKIFLNEEKRRLGIWVMALLSATHFLPGQPQVVALGLSSPHPTVEELVHALRNWITITPPQLEVFLRTMPDLFMLSSHTHRVRFLIVNAIARKDDALRAVAGGLAPRLKNAKPQEASKFSLWLRTVVPSQFHVPVSYVVEKARELNTMDTVFGSKTPTLEQVKKPFQHLPNGFADIRAFGNATNTVFVRIIDPEPLLLESGVPSFGGDTTAPEIEASRYDPTPLARALTAAIEQYAAQSALTRARVAKGLEISRLRDYVPVALMTQLEQFYGFSAKDDPSVCILLLDRLRHLWEVQLNVGKARPWAFLPESEMPSSLTLQTSPSPRVLLHCQRLLVECGGQPLMDLYNVLPADLKTVLLQLYVEPTQSHVSAAAAAGVANSASAPHDDAQITQALQTLVRTHSLFFFVKDGQVFTSRRDPGMDLNTPLTSKEQQQQQQHGGQQGKFSSLPVSSVRRGTRTGAAVVAEAQASITDAEMAQVVYNALPPDDWVLVDSLRNYIGKLMLRGHYKRNENLFTQTLRREFLARQHRLITVHPMFGFDKLVISRAGFKVKAPHLLSPRVETIGQLIKFMALLSVDSISDASLTRRIPQEGRSLLKTIGTVTDVAEQLPMWFVVQRDEFNFGSSLIRYIGPLARTPRSPYALQPPKRGVLTRKVPNDPFVELPPDEAESEAAEEWNDDWNEDNDPSGEANK